MGWMACKVKPKPITMGSVKAEFNKKNVENQHEAGKRSNNGRARFRRQTKLNDFWYSLRIGCETDDIH